MGGERNTRRTPEWNASGKEGQNGPKKFTLGDEKDRNLSGQGRRKGSFKEPTGNSGARDGRETQTRRKAVKKIKLRKKGGRRARRMPVQGVLPVAMKQRLSLDSKEERWL